MPAVPRLLQAAALTDTGSERDHNEDRVGVFAELGLTVVVDGMGGKGVGEVAAELALEAIEVSVRRWHGAPRQNGQSWQEHPLVVALKLANVRVYELGGSRQLRGAGAVVTAAQAVEGGVLIAHAGDSRCYRIRQGSIAQLTRDHALVMGMADISFDPDTPDDPAALMPRALGMRETLAVDVRFEPLVEGDTYLLCSDGLSGMLSDGQIVACLAAASDLDDACRCLVAAANDAGGFDNISVVLARWAPA